jgi:SRSO17 transposase
MVRELTQMGFEIELVLADSLYGESESNFLGCLEELKLNARGGYQKESWSVVAVGANSSVQSMARQLLQRREPPHRTGSKI